MTDAVNHPEHYRSNFVHSKCGQTIECIDIVRHFPFDLGNAIKYAWRHEGKGNPLEDLKKARWYLDDWIQELERVQNFTEAVENLAEERARLLDVLQGKPCCTTEDSERKHHPEVITDPRPWDTPEARKELFEKIAAEPDLPPLPVTHVTREADRVKGGPDESWQLVANDHMSAMHAWYTFNTSSVYLDHPARAAIRDEFLDLVSDLDPKHYAMLGPVLKEACEDWLYAQEQERC